MPDATNRRTELLDAIRSEPGDWTTGMALRVQQAGGWGCNRSVAREDLRHLAKTGLLIEHGPDEARFYRLNQIRDPRLGHGWQTPAVTDNRVKHRPRRR